jgi:hypothetical protein
MKYDERDGTEKGKKYSWFSRFSYFNGEVQKMLKRKREFICNFKIRKETFKALNWVFTRWGVINVIPLNLFLSLLPVL